MRARARLSGRVCIPLLLLLGLPCGWVAAVAHAAAEVVQTSLLPRELLFGPPQRTWPQLSPDGRRLAFLAPDRDGVTNIWLTARGLDLASARPLMHANHRDVPAFRWAEDGVHVLYWRD